ncbi:hypothetical protein [Actinomadura sp. SCN-SB]|uniref:hypothetical protein n=1 Tax=Actinomadura sp. SCN-SB TaxID=3373092 RepID=UPI00375094B3
MRRTDHPAHDEVVDEDGIRPRPAARQSHRQFLGRTWGAAVGGALVAGLVCWLLCAAGLLLFVKTLGRGLPGLGALSAGWSLAAAGWFAVVVAAADWVVRSTLPAAAFSDAPTGKSPADTEGSGV